MQVIEAYKPFEIQEIELSKWKKRPAKNNFFELVLIKQGRGTQCINYNYYDYQSDSIFLLPPLQCHSFQIEEPTKFVFLKFTSGFFKANKENAISHADWFSEASYILSNYNQMPGDVIQSDIDRQHLYTLVELVTRENKNQRSNSGLLIKSLMTSVLEILLRNIKQSAAYETAFDEEKDDRIARMLTYINENIREPEKLKVDELARSFLLSPTYVSEFFRKKVKMSLREYVLKAKLKLVEIRLLNSDYTLSEIADELRFTDVSHLSKTFKKYTGISPRAFKKQGEYVLLKRSNCN
ncbi:MAG: AraC family transcriptional regulator [Bacteroidota bacterium]